MMIEKRSPAAESFSRLRSLNALLNLVMGSDPQLASDLRAAIDFAQKHPSADPQGNLFLEDSIRKLIELHQQGGHRCAFEHCDLSSLEDDDPLWIRAHLLRHLRRLAGAGEGLLLVTGLRRLVCPVGKRWTEQRKALYRQRLQYCQQLVASYASPGLRLQLIFL